MIWFDTRQFARVKSQLIHEVNLIARINEEKLDQSISVVTSRYKLLCHFIMLGSLAFNYLMA